MRELHSALPEPCSAHPEEQRSAFPEQRSAHPEEPHSAHPERRSESHCSGAVRYAARVAHPFRGSRVVAAEFESAERRRAVRPVKATALHPRVVAEAAVEFESAEQPRVAGSMPEATVLQRRAAVAPGSAGSFAEAQARRLAESEVSAAQAVAVLPAAQDAAVVLRAEQHAVVAPQLAARDVAEAPRQAAAARVGAAVLRPEEAAAQAGVAEVARLPAGRDAAAVLRRAARGAQALPSAAVFLPCRVRVRLAP